MDYLPRNPCAARDKLEEDGERSKTRKEEERLVINKNLGGDSKKITRHVSVPVDRHASNFTHGINES
jgi:hypothetical protein